VEGWVTYKKKKEKKEEKVEEEYKAHNGTPVI
jgi:hypothetical protein